MQVREAISHETAAGHAVLGKNYPIGENTRSKDLGNLHRGLSSARVAGLHRVQRSLHGAKRYRKDQFLKR